MGNQQHGIDPSHVRIYTNLIQIQSPDKRASVIRTCLGSMEYIQSAKRAGLYSHLLNYLSILQSGGNPPLLPGENATFSAPATSVPRSMQPVHMTTPYTATHPSIAHKESQALSQRTDHTPAWKVLTDHTNKQKAISYFSSCLEVLGIKEEVALTEESLKKAYKKMAIKAHPDKGGSEEYFEAVTRAYAYLTEILRHMRGSKKETTHTVESPSQAVKQRDMDSKKWEMGGKPVVLDPNNMNLNTFNKLFEENRIPDPDSDGYGDWLKGTDSSSSSGPTFTGKFNRDVFNRMFDEEARKSQRESNQLVVHPGEMALTMNPNYGVEFVAERPSTYTAAPNSKMQFTDLRGAYTSESTMSDKVANVAVTDRNLEQYRASRERAPDPLTENEMQGIREFERRQQQTDELRERRRAEMAMTNQQYFDRMKQMVITNGATDLNQKKLGY